MAVTLTPTPFQTVLDATGVAVDGALIYTYVGGTTTALATYTTSVGDVANANPIVADSAGRYVAYLAAGANYKFVFKTAAGATIRTQDNVLAVPGSAVNLDIQGTVGVAVTAGQVCYLSSGLESTPLTPGLWYLADADAAVSSTTCQSIGIAVSAIPINTAGTIRLAGLATTAGAVVVGSTYYVSATAGAITSSAPTLARVVGVADTTSTLILAATSAVVATLPNPIAQNLLFVDNTYDIGASGASRPRDLFVARNTTLGGTLGVTGTSTLAALSVTGAATVSTTLAVTGATTLTGGLNTPLVVAQGGTGRATATTAYAILAAGTTATSAQQSIAPSTAGFVLTDNGVGALPSFQANASSLWGLSASVATNILTVALTTASGSTPSASTPVTLSFRNATTATGDMTTISVTAASTIAVPNTATLGTSNSVPFRLWVVAFNDGGTVRLGVMNCTIPTAHSASIYQLAAWGLASSTAITTGSDSAQVFYTGSAVTSKAYTVLGYVTYESGLATAGTWSAAPDRVQAYVAGTPLPGQVVQVRTATYATQTTSSSATYADTGLTVAITPTSAANGVKVDCRLSGVAKQTNDTAVNLKLLRGATELGQFGSRDADVGSGATNVIGQSGMVYLDFPSATSAQTYKATFASNGNCATAFVQFSSARSSIYTEEVIA